MVAVRLVRRWLPLLALPLAACRTITPTYVELRSAADPSNARGYLLPLGHNIGGNATTLGPVAGDVGSASYVLDPTRHEVFLLEGDLRAGIQGHLAGEGSAIQYLHLRQPTSLGPVMSEDISSLDPSRWTSFRVYDKGECSILQPWDRVAESIVRRIEEKFTTSDDVEGGQRARPSRLRPILRAAPGRGPVLEADADRFRVEMGFTARRIGGTFGCSGAHVRFSFNLAFQPHRGARRESECFLPSEVDLTSDFVGVVEDLDLDVDYDDDDCLIEGLINDNLRERLRVGLWDGIREAVRDATLLDPAVIGYDTIDCTCDDDCSGGFRGPPPDPLPWGPRHHCVVDCSGSGRCRVQIEPDRINIRPDGIEIVLSEGPADPQDAWLHADGRAAFLCERRGSLTTRATAPDRREVPVMAIWTVTPPRPRCP